MKKRLIKIIILSFVILIQYVSTCFASVGAKAKTDTLEVEQGATFDVYVTLDVQSEAYDIKFNLNEADLVSKSEVIKTIEGNKLSGENRIYLLQIDSAENRIKYPVGTKIACMRYTVAENASIGKTIEINVTGDIVGDNNSENSINEIVKVKVIEKSSEKDEEKKKNETDNTLSNEKLPNTGIKIKNVGIIAFVIFLFIYSAYKCKKYKDLK